MVFSSTVVPQFLIQGGDIINNDGTSGESIYGKTFEDENFILTHEQVGMVGMSTDGPNKNHSQFYITTVPCQHLDGRNVIFGQVKKGFNILIEISELPWHDDMPIENIIIHDCGEIQPGESWNFCEQDETEDTYPPWPDDWDLDIKTGEQCAMDAIERIKDSGNFFFNNGNLVDSERKYIKALRYIKWYTSYYDSEEEKIEDFRISCLANLAAVKLKKENHKEVIELCSQILVKDKNNGKALYRRAQARLALHDYDKALNDLRCAINLHPNDPNIKSVLEKVKKNKIISLRRERIVFSRLFK